MRLIPKADELGWTPYAWLVYLGIFWLAALVDDPTPTDWTLTALGTALFLPLYFWGYWLSGRKALMAVAGLIACWASCSRHSTGAPVSSSSSLRPTLGYAGSAAFAFRCSVWPRCLRSRPGCSSLPPWFWIPGTVFSLLVGGINIHYAGVRRSQAALRRTQDEVERLAKLAERERIARDLHDLLGHTLTVITRKAELARRSGREGSRAGGTKEIAEVETGGSRCPERGPQRTSAGSDRRTSRRSWRRPGWRCSRP